MITNDCGSYIRKFALLITGWAVCCFGKCQVAPAGIPEGSLNAFAKLYLQTDRSAYLAGDTIWAKGFFTNAENRSVTPQTLTLELLDLKAGKKIVAQTFLPSGKTFPASIVLPPGLSTGAYMIRAYSRNLIQENRALFTKLVKIYSVGSRLTEEEPVYERALLFYPEGSRLVEGVMNKVAFKYADALGAPSEIAGKIVSASGEQICEFKSSHNGMGFFSLDPKPGASYFAIIEGDHSNKKYPLPASIKGGAALKVAGDSTRLSFAIQALAGSGAQPSILVLQGAGKMLYSTTFKTGETSCSGSIDISRLPSGVARLALFSRDTQLLAERLCFIDNREYMASANLSVALLSRQYRAENLLSLNLDDAAAGAFAVSVTDAGFEEPERDRQNIYSANLLTCYLKNRIYDAGSYWDELYQDRSALLDLVMLTGIWSGLKWEDRKNSGMHSKKGEPGLSGTVFYKGTSRRYINKAVSLLAISEADSTSKTTVFNTDTAGSFRLSGLDFLGPTRLLFGAATKKSDFIDVVLNAAEEDTLAIEYPRVRAINSLSKNMGRSPFDSLIHTKEYMENITVSARTKDRMQMLVRKYATGRFRDLYGEVYELIPVKAIGNLFDYLRMQQPMVRVEFDLKSNQYYIKARKRDGTFDQAALYLDEAPVQNQLQLYAVDPADVAMIKIVEGIDFIAGRGSIPSVAIYTKKGRDFKAAGNKYDIEYVEGYAKAPEFYNPVYRQKDTAGPADRRITLYWNPRAATSNRVHFIPIHFYNTDNTVKFAVKAAGVTESGRLLSFYKTLL
ncbi:hypothetical protein [Niabella drilacis]|uniref:MG2 domain-containing protein n=1 Tax=Niabella drilacis (strain DSM 25811 / CCM 8410 / CCUG 62505 / LMG 26954 / E90) TaxID=1285928 RepID=A0A1G6Y0G4_NIADE|nr:hypothetical protein [Niabella drilacis]SDD83800.1 hypothetical protein SAMN04487894_11487 [Niabella drilacis]